MKEFASLFLSREDEVFKMISFTSRQMELVLPIFRLLDAEATMENVSYLP